MLRRLCPLLAAAEGVITHARSRSVVLRKTLETRYFHEYELDHQAAAPYILKWKSTPECEFTPGTKVKFEYAEKEKDREIARHSIQACGTPQSTPATTATTSKKPAQSARAHAKAILNAIAPVSSGSVNAGAAAQLEAFIRTGKATLLLPPPQRAAQPKKSPSLPPSSETSNSSSALTPLEEVTVVMPTYQGKSRTAKRKVPRGQPYQPNQPLSSLSSQDRSPWQEDLALGVPQKRPVTENTVQGKIVGRSFNTTPTRRGQQLYTHVYTLDGGGRYAVRWQDSQLFEFAVGAEVTFEVEAGKGSSSSTGYQSSVKFVQAGTMRDSSTEEFFPPPPPSTSAGAPGKARNPKKPPPAAAAAAKQDEKQKDKISRVTQW